MDGVSIITLSRNGAGHLSRLLETFLANNTHQPVEWIIIDHGSTDDTRAAVARFADRVCIKLVRRAINHSFAASCNYGASKARYPLLLFLNNDIIYTADPLPEAVSALGAPRIGAVGVRLDDDPLQLPPGAAPSVQHTGVTFEWDAAAGFHKPVQTRHAPAEAIPPSGPRPAVTAAFMLCTRRDFMALGGFCEEYDYGLEDIDFCLRLKDVLGKECWCINSTALQHVEGAARNLEAAARQRARQRKNEAVFKRRAASSARRHAEDDRKPPAATAAAGDGRVRNVLFVLYQHFGSNSSIHARLHADRLADQGVDALFAVPFDHADAEGEPRVRTFAEVERHGVVFPDGRGPDIVHGWTPREIVRPFADAMRDRYDCPLVVHLEDNEEYLLESYAGLPYSAMEHFSVERLDTLTPPMRYHPVRGRAFLERADGVTVIIEALNRFNVGCAPAMVLPPPVDETLFQPRPDAAALRAELGVPEGTVALAYTGNVHTGNRHEVRELYRAVHLLNERGVPAVLLRTGANAVSLGDEEWLERHALSLGWVERRRLPEVLAAADVLAQPGGPGPFNDERIPSKLPEYFAMGKPVVLPRTNLGLHVVHGKEGYVAEIADAFSIADAVVTIISDPEVRRGLERGAADFFARHLSFAATGIRLSELYSAAVHRHHAEKF